MCKISLYTNLSGLTFIVSFFYQWTPLHTTAGEGRCEDTLKYLVGKGADLNIKNNNGVNTVLKAVV